MKKLIALLAVISYVPFAHAAEGDWTHSGEFRLQYDNTDNRDFSDSTKDHGQTIHQRTKLNTTVRAGEKMTVNLGLVHNADWGSNPDQTPDSVTSATPPASADTSNILTVNELYMTWQASDEATFKFGRIAQTLGDGTVVSANEYENVQKAFDAAAVIYDLEAVRLAGFAVRGGNVDTASTATNTDLDTFGSFYGIAADLKTLPSFLKMAALHYVVVKRDPGAYTVNGATANLIAEDSQRIGLTVAGDVAGFDYRATYAVYTGTGAEAVSQTTKADIDANMMDLEAGYSMPAMMNFRVHAGYHQDSGADSATGDNKHYQPFHYQQHENAGLMDVIGWGNLTYTRAGVALSPMEDLTVGAEYLMFTKTEKTDGIYDKAGTALISNATFGSDTDIGNELDVVVTKKYTNNFAIQARYGMFSPGDGIKDTIGDDTITQYYLEGKMSF